jgi:hypothetical protein
MSPSQWGPPTWIFLHTLAEKIKEESYPTIGRQLIHNIIHICGLLPCPDCSAHAKKFWSNVTINNVQKKKDLIDLLYVFHNSVNQRKRIIPFPYDNLQIYNSKGVIETFNSFVKNFNTRGNMNLLTDSFHRSRLLANLRQWMINNINHFEL